MKFDVLKKITFLSIFSVIMCGCSSPYITRGLSSDAVCNSYSEEALPEMPESAVLRKKGVNSFDFNNSSDRKIAYDFSFTIHAAGTEEMQKNIQDHVKSFGGYVLILKDNFLTVKVPKNKADEFLKKCESLGELSNVNMRGTDMTDSIADLEMRLASQKKMQKRLLELLDKAAKVEDMLKIEVQLNKVETEIERLTAQLVNSNKLVNFVTFNITLSGAAVIEREDIALEQFAFLRNFICYQGGQLKEIFDSFELPETFVPYFSKYNLNDDSFNAITADNCILAINKYAVSDDSSFDFWAKLIERSLKVLHSCSDIKVEKIGDDKVEITAVTNKRGYTDSYFMCVWLEDSFWHGKQLCTVEFFGEKKVFDDNIEIIKNIIKNR